MRRWSINPTSAEDARECDDVRGMRKRITRYSYEDALTRAVMDSARHQGLNGEDTMTMLSFEALRRLEKLEEMLFDQAMRSPVAPFMPFDAPKKAAP